MKNTDSHNYEMTIWVRVEKEYTFKIKLPRHMPWLKKLTGNKKTTHQHANNVNRRIS